LSTKKELIEDIQNLLNSYEGVHLTSINPDLLEFMDEETLKSIIGALLDEKESILDPDTAWLEQFKSNKQ